MSASCVLHSAPIVLMLQELISSWPRSSAVSRVPSDVHFFFFQAEDGIRDHCVTGVQTCALPIYLHPALIAQAEIADKIVPRAVAGTCRTLDQEHEDEEDWANCAARDQKSDWQRIGLHLTVLCSHNTFLSCHLTHTYSL